jgi:hypothetical protein
MSEQNEIIADYLAGVLSPERRRQFEQSLENNRELQAQVAAMQTLIGQMKAAPQEQMPRDLTADVMEKIRRENVVPFPLRIRMVLKHFPAAAAAALVLWLTLFSTSPINEKNGNNGSNGQQKKATHVASATENHQQMALQWLAAKQQSDGSWDVAAYGGQQIHTVGISSLALMALLEKGAEYRENVAKSVQFVRDNQSPDGRFGPACSTSMYNHGIATVALLKAYKDNGNNDLRYSLACALSYIIRAQAKSGGWGYLGRSDEMPNTAVTAWQIHALSLATAMGWDEARVALDRGSRYVASFVDAAGKVGYGNASPSAPVTSALTAMGAYALLTAETETSRTQGRQILAAVAEQVSQRKNASCDPYFAYFFVQAARAAGGDEYAQNLRRDRDLLGQTQAAIGAEAGSFPVSITPHAQAGGQIYATAIAALTL